MSIEANVLAAATRGVDQTDEMPEITAAMLEAGAQAIPYSGIDDVQEVARAVFEAMWAARKPLREAA